MQSMMTFARTPRTQTRVEEITQFQKTSGLKPLGRWIRADLSAGFDLFEKDDSKELTEVGKHALAARRLATAACSRLRLAVS